MCILNNLQASQGTYSDQSGPEMARLLAVMSDDAEWPLTVDIACTAVVPDETGGAVHCARLTKTDQLQCDALLPRQTQSARSLRDGPTPPARSGWTCC